MSPDLNLPDASATERLGAALAAGVIPGRVLHLKGDLGSGKTTLVRGGLRACGVEGPVRSPTYTLVEHYPVSSLYFYHFDFYRLVSSNEWDDAGLSEYFRADAVCLVEWPERVGSRLGTPDLALSLAHAADGGRDLRVEASSPEGERCLSALARGVPTSG